MPPPDDAREVLLDVRGLPPPEPMVMTLDRLESLAPDEVLVHVNSRVPIYLLPILEERGWQYEVRHLPETIVQVWIWRARGA